jgi:hypothetical protein
MKIFLEVCSLARANQQLVWDHEDQILRHMDFFEVMGEQEDCSRVEDSGKQEVPQRNLPK